MMCARRANGPAHALSRSATSWLSAALVCAAVWTSSCAAATSESRADQGALRFDVRQGLYLNSFVRQGPVAAHLVLRSGRDPRILVAFPAGDSGVGLWFDRTRRPVRWTLGRAAEPTVSADAKGRPLYGITFDARVRTESLVPTRAVLSSIRILRMPSDLAGVPRALLVEPSLDRTTLSWARDRIDGAPGYKLAVTVIHGSLQDHRLVAAADGVIGLRIVAVSGEQPLTPLADDALLSAGAGKNAAARNTLRFLSYREKFLAGSWRFDTYFGRDTLMSVRLLMPGLQSAAIDSGLRSVLARLSPAGEVAHEEAIGEFAVLSRMGAGAPASDAPVFDYGMIDGTYMLAPVVAAWLLDDPRGPAHAAAFLAGRSGRAGAESETAGAALVRNLRLVLAQTRAFADKPTAAHLLSIKPARTTGEWRDSQAGLGWGRYPYDVNAVFAPAALSAISRLARAGLLEPYETAEDRRQFNDAGRLAQVWLAKAPGHFEVAIPADAARRDVVAYAREHGVSEGPALASLGPDGVRFHALSLKADGAPVGVVNSDEGFALLFGQPDAIALDHEVGAMMRPFPAGLMTDVGLLVANPAFAAADEKPLFSRRAYHGEVVWSWQQAVLAAGLQRQLARTDLPAHVRARLRAAQAQLWRAIEATKSIANAELWSWTYTGGRYRVAPYGDATSGSDEANAAQLWSSVFLALKPPPSIERPVMSGDRAAAVRPTRPAHEAGRVGPKTCGQDGGRPVRPQLSSCTPRNGGSLR
jgi:hypothetical protein